MTELIQCKEVKFAVPWGHIAAKTYGPSTGKPVLLVHGRLDNAGSFSRLMGHLPIDTFYYVCIDLPGHGWSSHFPSWLVIDKLYYVYALHHILEALKWQTCVYIGHSMGGQIGILYSIFQPHRIKKLIALDVFLPYMSNFNVAVTNLENAFAFLNEANSNVAPMLYTKKEILHALKTMRMHALNSEAANALFERAVTEINGKYKYNRDVRVKHRMMSFALEKDHCVQYVRKLSVPIYILVASNGMLVNEELNFLINEVNPKTKVQLIHVEGNHDVHNNDPEKVAPFIRKILITDNSNKL